MFGVTIVNNSGCRITVKPDGNVSSVARTIVIDSFPFPVGISELTGQHHVPQSMAAQIFDGNTTNEIGYEGTGNLVFTFGMGGAYTVSSGYGTPVSGQLPPPLQTLPAVQSLAWAPSNPVHAGTQMTISWAPVPGATSYTVAIWRDGAPIVTTEVSGTSFGYALQQQDIFHMMMAQVCACSTDAMTSDMTSMQYYCGNSGG